MAYKNLRMALLAAAAAFTFTAPAKAELNSSLQSVLDNNADLSRFRDALKKTGVGDSLPDGKYTLFVPTNGVIEALTKDRYPCMFSENCQQEAVDLIKNHIAYGDYNLGDVSRGKGGIYSVDKRLVNIFSPGGRGFVVSGNNVVRSYNTAGGSVYVIDGVIANDYELSRYLNTSMPGQGATTTEETNIKEDTTDSTLLPDRSVTKTITTTKTVITNEE